MNTDKQIIIDELIQRINGSPFLLVVDYGGLTVDRFTELRNRLRETGAACHVTKNSFLRRAATAVEYPEELGSLLVGQTAAVVGESDIVAAAKVLKNFHAEFDKPAIRGGVLDGNFLDEAAVRQLADLPSREVLLAKFLGLLNQPGSSLARLLNEPASALARVLKAKADLG